MKADFDRLAADLYVRMVDRGDEAGDVEDRLQTIAKFCIKATLVYREEMFKYVEEARVKYDAQSSAFRDVRYGYDNLSNIFKESTEGKRIWHCLQHIERLWEANPSSELIDEMLNESGKHLDKLRRCNRPKLQGSS